MKVTNELTELVVELGELESFERAGLVFDSQGVSVRELLQLFNETENPRSKQVVREIFDEVGYGWFIELDEMTFRSAAGLKAIKSGQNSGCDKHVVATMIAADKLMSDDDFLDLMPASSHFH